MSGVEMSVMNSFKVHPRAKAPNLYREGFGLGDVYAKFSNEKDAAWDRCYDMCRELNGTGFRITAHNTFGFSVAFEFVNPENGRMMLAHITPRIHHAYYIS